MIGQEIKCRLVQSDSGVCLANRQSRFPIG